MAHVEFSEWLQEELRKRRWEQAELSRYGGITAGQVSRILSGERKPGPTACRAIARALNIPPEEVFRHAGLLPRQRKTLKGADELLHYFNELSDEDRQRLLVIAKAFHEANPG